MDYLKTEAERNVKLNAWIDKIKNKEKMPTISESIFKIIGSVFVAVSLWCYYTFSNGYVLFKLWNWFVTPIFPSLSTIHFGMLQAAGLFAVVQFCSFHFNMPEPPSKSDPATKLMRPILYPWFTLLSGWVLFKLIS